MEMGVWMHLKIKMMMGTVSLMNKIHAQPVLLDGCQITPLTMMEMDVLILKKMTMMKRH